MKSCLTICNSQDACAACMKIVEKRKKRLFYDMTHPGH